MMVDTFLIKLPWMASSWSFEEGLEKGLIIELPTVPKSTFSGPKLSDLHFLMNPEWSHLVVLWFGLVRNPVPWVCIHFQGWLLTSMRFHRCFESFLGSIWSNFRSEEGWGSRKVYRKIWIRYRALWLRFSSFFPFSNILVNFKPQLKYRNAFEFNSSIQIN